MRIIAAMVVGPGEGNRYLDQTLRLAEGWADRVIAYTDHIDPMTELVLDQHNATTYRVTEPAAELAPRFTEDESFVRNKLMEALDMLTRPGDLIVVLDADEVLLPPPTGEPGLTVRSVLEILAEDTAHQAWSATFFHLWDPEGTVYRCDGGWAPAPQFRIYRHEPGARVEGGKMACKAIPSSAIPRAHTGLCVAHWGYAQAVDRKAKHARYLEHDGGRFHSLVHIQSIVQPPELRAFG